MANGSTVAERFALSWRSIFAGTLIALLFYFTLFFLGMAVGGAALHNVIHQTSGSPSGSGLGVGSGIWLVLSALISLFFGSYFASRAGGLILPRVGSIQGLTVAALFFVFLLSQAGATIGMVGQNLGSAVGMGAQTDLTQNVEVHDIIGGSISNLKTKSPQNQVVIGLAARLIRGNDADASAYLAREAGITRAEAERILIDTKAKVQAKAKEVGAATARVISVTGWSLFILLTLGSIVSAIGGGLGARRELLTVRRHEAEWPRGPRAA